MGLLCAVLMDNEGHAQKREVMRARAPVLLHPSFLERARSILRACASGDESARAGLLTRGLFHLTHSEWLRPERPEVCSS